MTATVFPAVPMRMPSEIVESCQRGDDSAWEMLVRQYTRLVYGIAWRFTRSNSEAEDMTQEIFIRVFRSIGTFRSAEASFTTWLTRLTRNLLIDYYRRTGQNRVTESGQNHRGFDRLPARAADHPEHLLAAREAADLVQSVLLLLEPELREQIVYRDLDDMGYREIAETVGIPVGTVKSRLNRARAELHRLTRKYRATA